MATVSLLDLTISAQRYADLQNSNYISAQEWTDYINFGIRQYWNKINQLVEDYNITEVFFTTNGTDTDYPLPDDFMYTRGFDVQMTPSSGPAPENAIWLSLRPYEFKERSYYGFPWTIAYNGMYSFRYRIMSNFVRFLPIPVPIVNIRHSYIPVAPQMFTDSDTMNGYNGFNEYISLLAAYRAMAKQDFPTEKVEALIKEWENTLATQANERNRDIGPASTDVYRRGWNALW
jgi:hypothetical protein